MPQTAALHNTPQITTTPDGKNWWRYVVTYNGEFLLDGWSRGKRADAQRDAAHRLKQWRAQQQEAAA